MKQRTPEDLLDRCLWMASSNRDRALLIVLITQCLRVDIATNLDDIYDAWMTARRDDDQR